MYEQIYAVSFLCYMDVVHFVLRAFMLSCHLATCGVNKES